MRYMPESHKLCNILALQGPYIEEEISDAILTLQRYVWRVRRSDQRQGNDGKTYNKMQVIRLRLMYRAQRMNRGQFLIYRKLVQVGVVGAALGTWEPR